MELAIEGTSATEAARRLGLSRQMVHYHALALEKAGFLVSIGETRRRNMVERRLQATARAYVIGAQVLGPLDPSRRRTADSTTAAALLGLCSRVQCELAASSHEAGSSAALPITSLSSKLRFATPARRTEFIRALGEAVVNLIRAHTAPNYAPTSETAGVSYGLMLGLYPLPRPAVQCESARSHADPPRES